MPEISSTAWKRRWAAEWTCAAFSLLASHEFDSATKVAQTAVQRTPDLPAAHLALGLALQMKGRLAEAAEAMKKAADLAPKDEYVARERKWALALAATGGRGIKETAHAAIPESRDQPKRREEQTNRTWIDSLGRHKVQAALVRVQDNTVHLKRQDTGQVIAVPIEKLTKVDRACLKLVANPGR